MDLLEYGMKYENSRNRVTRAMAKGVLAALQLQADLYEKYLSQNIPLSPESGDDQEILSRILEKVKEKYKVPEGKDPAQAGKAEGCEVIKE